MKEELQYRSKINQQNNDKTVQTIPDIQNTYIHEENKVSCSYPVRVRIF